MQRLHEQLLVRRVEGEAIAVPDVGKQRPQEGRVCAIGKRPGADQRTPALDVNVGDRILFGRYSGTAVRFGGEDLLMLGEDEFLVVLA